MTPPVHILVVGAAPDAQGAAHYAAAVQRAERVVAADAGLEVCLRAGRIPDVCVGDFDSVDPGALAEAEHGGAEIRRYPAMKNESDLDLAVRAARELGATRITITAAFTGRLDHTLASLGTVLAAADLLAEAEEPRWHGYGLAAAGRPRVVLTEPVRTIISLMAPGGALVSVDGVRYPLRREVLPPLSSLGLSNVATEHAQSVTVHEGAVLVLVSAVTEPLPLS